MNLREFSARNRRRSECPTGFNHKLSDWSLSDWFMATLGELGEGANIGKKLKRIEDVIVPPSQTETEEELKEKLADELADTFIYLDLLCQSRGICLADAVEKKFAKTSAEIGYVE